MEEVCIVCKRKIEDPNYLIQNFVVNDGKNKTCHECCEKQRWNYIMENDKVILYLVERVWSPKVFPQERIIVTTITNWLETIQLKPTRVKRGKHNIATYRVDVWFDFEGEKWWGVNYGNNTQILHCKKLKKG